MGLIISVFETEEPGSSPGGATKLSYDVMVSITASEAVCLGSNPGETTNYPIGTGGNLIYKRKLVYLCLYTHYHRVKILTILDMLEKLKI